MADPRDESDARATRTATMEEAFELREADRPQLPAAIQQVMIDERPQGAMKIDVKRDLAKVLRDIKTVATAAGDDFFYSWPTRNKDGSQGVVEGASVKCANAVARIFGNCSVRVRAFDQGPHWIFYAQFYDMETGFVYERPFQQRKAQNIGGKMDKDRATDIVFQIGTSKAARNAVCNALSEFTDYAFDVAKEQLVEKIGRNLPKHLEKVRQRLVELKVDIKRVELSRGKTADKWLASDLARVISEIQAIADGMGHPDEVWPPAEAAGPRPTMEGEPEPAKAAPAATEAPAAEKKAEPVKEAAKPAEEVEDPDIIRQDAYDAAQAFVAKVIDQLGTIPPHELAEHKVRIQDSLKKWPDLDPEDLIVVQGRWNSAILEAERAAHRNTGKRR